MKFTHLFTAICCAICWVSCEKKEHSDLFDYSDPIDLSAILQAYDWYQHYEGNNKDSILYTKFGLEFLQPFKVVESIELTNGFKHFAQQIAFITAQLLIENGECWVSVTDATLAAF